MHTVPKVHALYHHNFQYYLVMDKVGTMTYQTALKLNPECRSNLQEIFKTELQTLHSIGINHLDRSPKNQMVSHDFKQLFWESQSRFNICFLIDHRLRGLHH